MSSIFGCTLKSTFNSINFSKIFLDHNRIYGGDLEESENWDNSLMGSCKNNFTNRPACSSAVLLSDKYKAVIDAVLYNRDEMKDKLISQFELSYEIFQKLSDEELLFLYIQKFGFESLSEVNGDFAGAFWNIDNQNWTLFRDHNGIRPLFYYLDDETFAFSTDIRGIISLPGVDTSINETYFYRLMMGYNELTLQETDYKYINCIRPASYTVISPETRDNEKAHIAEHVYWTLGAHKIRFNDETEYSRELRRLITDSVKRRTEVISGNIGCELSGGLDSSIIAILINRICGRGKYFSWSWSTEDYPMQSNLDERKVIADICDQEHISCEYAKRTKPSDSKSIAEILKHNDVPYINTLYISEGSKKMAEKGIYTMFSGHGGDEGVSHRCNVYELWYHKEYMSFCRAIWNGTRGKKPRLVYFTYRLLRQIFVVNPYFKYEYRNRHNMEYFLASEFKDGMKSVSHPPLTFAYDPVSYIMQGGPRVRLDNAAVQGAQNSVQYIFPFLDYRVLDYAVSIPRFCFKNGFINRTVYREAFEDIMPESLKQVRYKDEPSMRGYEPSKEDVRKAADNANKMMKDLLVFLDKKRWSRYLDFDKFDDIILKKDCNVEDIERVQVIIDGLLRCAAIQNLEKH